MANYRERPAAMQQLLNSPSGPIVKHLEKIGQATIDITQRRAYNAHVRTGDYDRSFSRHTSLSGRGPVVTVKNISHHALYLELGTRPHLITSRTPGRPLRFTVRGRTVFAMRVHHPGTRPYRLLATGLEDAMRMYA